MNKHLFFLALVTIIISCQKGAEIEYKFYDEKEFAVMSKYINIPTVPDDYTLKTPEYIANSFFANPSRNSEVTLGRVLFYDKNLSKDKKISCASCHDQKIAFSDSKALSDGANGRVTTRNSLALGSVLNFSVYYGDERFGRVPFFWDNSATTVQEQSERTLANPNEMDMHINEVVQRVKENEYYPELFEKAYGSGSNINKENVLNAISAFVNAIPAYNTKWDAELNNHFKKYNNTRDLVNYDFSGYTLAENKGKKIYLQKCANCHGETIGSPSKTRANNGLAVTYSDKGIGGVSYAAKDEGLFKVPTLRNILLTGPYMHDGTLTTIDDVLNHYSNNIKAHKNLDEFLKLSNQPKKFNFSEEDKNNLKAFFATLTDEKLITDSRFSDPFIK